MEQADYREHQRIGEVVECDAFARGEISGLRWGLFVGLIGGLFVAVLTSAFSYDTGRRAVQAEAIKSGKAHYVPSECSANFRWNE